MLENGSSQTPPKNVASIRHKYNCIHLKCKQIKVTIKQDNAKHNEGQLKVNVVNLLKCESGRERIKIIKRHTE